VAGTKALFIKLFQPRSTFAHISFYKNQRFLKSAGPSFIFGLASPFMFIILFFLSGIAGRHGGEQACGIRMKRTIIDIAV